MRPVTKHLSYWSVLALVVLPIILAVARYLHVLDYAVGDQAIIQLHAGDIPGHPPLVGVYSRLGFHHPGPLLYFVAAPALRVFGGVGLVLTAAGVAISCLGGLLLVLYRRGGPALFALGAVFSILLTRSMALDVLSLWNPYVLIIPFSLAIALTWSVWCRDWRALPWLAVVGSFVAQAHLGLAPVMAFLFGSSAIAVVGSWIRARRTRSAATKNAECPRSLLLLSLAVLAVVWTPPLIDQLTGDPGNLTSILNAGSSSASGQRLGLTRGLGLLGLLLGRVDPLRFNSTGDLRILASVHDGSILWLGVPFLALALSAGLAWRHGLRHQLRLSGLLFGLVIVSVVALASMTGLPYLYLERWLVVISAFVWLNLLWTTLSALLPGLEQRELIGGSGGNGQVRPSAIVCSVAALLAVVVALGPLADTPGHTNDVTGSQAIAALIAPTRAAITECGLVGVAPTGSPAGLLVASGLVAQLNHEGFDVGIDDLFAFSHGEQHALRGRSADCTVLVVASADPVVTACDDSSTIAAADSLTPEQRADYQQFSSLEVGRADSGTSDAISDETSDSWLHSTEISALVELRNRAMVWCVKLESDLRATEHD